MPLDPSIYSQVGKVNLGAGIADELNQFTNQRAAQEDRQNRLAQLAMQMQEHKAQQAALASLTPEKQNMVRLGMSIKDIQEREDFNNFITKFNNAKSGVPASTTQSATSPAETPNDQGITSGGLVQPQATQQSPEQTNDLITQAILSPNPHLQKGGNYLRMGNQFQETQDAKVLAAKQHGELLQAMQDNAIANRPDTPVQTQVDAKGGLWEKERGGQWTPALGPDNKQLTSTEKQQSPLVSIVDENGNPVLSTRENAIGKVPAPSNAASFGGREGSQIQRIMLATNQVSKDLSNLTNLPLTSSRGIFGGRSQGQGLFEAGKETLTNSMTTQEVRTYNIMATGIQRNLAAIEAAGMMPSGTLTHQMDSLILKEGDSNLSKLQALAQIRQIADAGIETLMSNPRVSKEQKTHMQDIQKNLANAVPFTQDELNGLQITQQTNPNVTLGEVMKELKKKQSTSATQIAHPPDIQQMIDANRR